MIPAPTHLMMEADPGSEMLYILNILWIPLLILLKTVNKFPSCGVSRGMFINYLAPHFIWFFGEHKIGNFPKNRKGSSV
jgi:hypothetical protein